MGGDLGSLAQFAGLNRDDDPNWRAKAEGFGRFLQDPKTAPGILAQRRPLSFIGGAGLRLQPILGPEDTGHASDLPTRLAGSFALSPEIMGLMRGDFDADRGYAAITNELASHQEFEYDPNGITRRSAGYNWFYRRQANGAPQQQQTWRGGPGSNWMSSEEIMQRTVRQLQLGAPGDLEAVLKKNPNASLLEQIYGTNVWWNESAKWGEELGMQLGQLTDAPHGKGLLQGAVGGKGFMQSWGIDDLRESTQADMVGKWLMARNYNRAIREPAILGGMGDAGTEQFELTSMFGATMYQTGLDRYAPTNDMARILSVMEGTGQRGGILNVVAPMVPNPQTGGMISQFYRMAGGYSADAQSAFLYETVAGMGRGLGREQGPGGQLVSGPPAATRAAVLTKDPAKRRQIEDILSDPAVIASPSLGRQQIMKVLGSRYFEDPNAGPILLSTFARTMSKPGMAATYGLVHPGMVAKGRQMRAYDTLMSHMPRQLNEVVDQLTQIGPGFSAFANYRDVIADRLDAYLPGFEGNLPGIVEFAKDVGMGSGERFWRTSENPATGELMAGPNDKVLALLEAGEVPVPPLIWQEMDRALQVFYKGGEPPALSLQARELMERVRGRMATAPETSTKTGTPPATPDPVKSAAPDPAKASPPPGPTTAPPVSASAATDAISKEVQDAASVVHPSSLNKVNPSQADFQAGVVDTLVGQALKGTPLQPGNESTEAGNALHEALQEQIKAAGTIKIAGREYRYVEHESEVAGYLGTAKVSGKRDLILEDVETGKKIAVDFKSDRSGELEAVRPQQVAYEMLDPSTPTAVLQYDRIDMKHARARGESIEDIARRQLVKWKDALDPETVHMVNPTVDEQMAVTAQAEAIAKAQQDPTTLGAAEKIVAHAKATNTPPPMGRDQAKAVLQAHDPASVAAALGVAGPASSTSTGGPAATPPNPADPSGYGAAAEMAASTTGAADPGTAPATSTSRLGGFSGTANANDLQAIVGIATTAGAKVTRIWQAGGGQVGFEIAFGTRHQQEMENEYIQNWQDNITGTGPFTPPTQTQEALMGDRLGSTGAGQMSDYLRAMAHLRGRQPVGKADRAMMQAGLKGAMAMVAAMNLDANHPVTKSIAALESAVSQTGGSTAAQWRQAGIDIVDTTSPHNIAIGAGVGEDRATDELITPANRLEQETAYMARYGAEAGAAAFKVRHGTQRGATEGQFNAAMGALGDIQEQSGRLFSEDERRGISESVKGLVENFDKAGKGSNELAEQYQKAYKMLSPEAARGVDALEIRLASLAKEFEGGGQRKLSGAEQEDVARGLGQGFRGSNIFESAADVARAVGIAGGDPGGGGVLDRFGATFGGMGGGGGRGGRGGFGGLGDVGWTMFNLQRWWRWTGAPLLNWEQQYGGQELGIQQAMFQAGQGGQELTGTPLALMRRTAGAGLAARNLGRATNEVWGGTIDSLLGAVNNAPSGQQDDIVTAMLGAGVAGSAALIGNLGLHAVTNVGRGIGGLGYGLGVRSLGTAAGVEGAVGGMGAFPLGALTVAGVLAAHQAGRQQQQQTGVLPATGSRAGDMALTEAQGASVMMRQSNQMFAGILPDVVNAIPGSWSAINEDASLGPWGRATNTRQDIGSRFSQWLMDTSPWAKANAGPLGLMVNPPVTKTNFEWLGFGPPDSGSNALGKGPWNIPSGGQGAQAGAGAGPTADSNPVITGENIDSLMGDMKGLGFSPDDVTGAMGAYTRSTGKPARWNDVIAIAKNLRMAGGAEFVQGATGTMASAYGTMPGTTAYQGIYNSLLGRNDTWISQQATMARMYGPMMYAQGISGMPAENLGNQMLQQYGPENALGGSAISGAVGNLMRQYMVTPSAASMPQIYRQGAALGLSAGQQEMFASQAGTEFGWSLLRPVTQEGNVQQFGMYENDLTPGGFGVQQRGAIENFLTQRRLGAAQHAISVGHRGGEWQSATPQTAAGSYGSFEGGNVPQGAMGAVQIQEDLMSFTKAMNVITDKMIASQRGYEDVQLQFARQRADLSYSQGMESIGLSQRMFEMRQGFQLRDLGIQQGQYNVQVGWQKQDWQTSETEASLSFGWGQQDYTRNIRLATGRERQQLIRERDRAQIMYGLQETQRERQGERIDIQAEWQNAAFTRQRAEIIALGKLQEEQFDMQRKHLTQNHNLAIAELDAQAAHMTEMRGLQDEQRQKERTWQLETQTYDLQRATDAAALAKMSQEAFNVQMKNQEAMMKEVGQRMQELEALILPGGRLHDAFVKFVNNIIAEMSIYGGGVENVEYYYNDPTLAGNPSTPSSHALGGIVTRPTLSWLAEAGPEAVLPLSLLPQMAGAMSGASGGSTGNGASIAQQVAQALQVNNQAGDVHVTVKIGDQVIEDAVVNVVQKPKFGKALSNTTRDKNNRSL
jgi:hypothetical protein